MEPKDLLNVLTQFSQTGYINSSGVRTVTTSDTQALYEVFEEYLKQNQDPDWFDDMIVTLDLQHDCITYKNSEFLVNLRKCPQEIVDRIYAKSSFRLRNTQTQTTKLCVYDKDQSRFYVLLENRQIPVILIQEV